MVALQHDRASFSRAGGLRRRHLNVALGLAISANFVVWALIISGLTKLL